MIDYIKLLLEIQVIKQVFLRENVPLLAFGLSFNPISKHNEVVKYECHFQGLRLTIRGSELTIQNSLCKFFKGYNHLNFTYSELIQTKNILETILGLDLRSAKVGKFEYGTVIQVENPKLVYNSIGMYKNRIPQQMTFNGSIYGVRLENTTHQLKIYDKTREASRNGLKLNYGLLRVEKRTSPSHLNSSPRFKNNQIQTFSDLCRRSTFQLLAEDLIKSLNKIEINEIGYYTDDLSIKDLRLLGYMQNYPIRSLIKEHHKKSFEVDQIRFKEILANRSQNNFDNFTQKVVEVIEEIVIN